MFKNSVRKKYFKKLHERKFITSSPLSGKQHQNLFTCEIVPLGFGKLIIKPKMNPKLQLMWWPVMFSIKVSRDNNIDQYVDSDQHFFLAES